MTRIPATEATNDSRPVSYWSDAANQVGIDMAGAPASAALAELLAQCGTDEDREGILAGSFELVEAP